VLFSQLVNDDLGCASYLVGCEETGEAVVVDPPLAIETVLREAERLDVRVVRTIETHTHADHVSGHGRLALDHGASHMLAGVVHSGQHETVRVRPVVVRARPRVFQVGAVHQAFLGDFLDAVKTIVDQGLTGTYNVASEQSLSVLEIVSLVESFAGKKLRVTHCPAFSWDVEESRISAQKIRATTGWRARHDITDAIRQVTEAELRCV
jgi:hypothetical protein